MASRRRQLRLQAANSEAVGAIRRFSGHAVLRNLRDAGHDERDAELNRRSAGLDVRSAFHRSYRELD